jgi:glutamate synthase domain-containing protein 2
MSDLGLQRHDPEKPIYLPSSSQMINSHGGLNVLIQRLHTEVPGVPVIVKLAAGNDLEQDMEIAIQAGADVLAIDGAQGGTHGSPSILVNDFGLPTLHALVRAVRYLRQTGYNQQVDLVISGGLRTPGDVLKALALGASAVYFGTAALYAATHAQLAKTLPFDPPTAITWSSGKLKDNFDAQKGSESLLNFLVSFADELQFGLQSLGKATLQELSADDLFAWDERVARVTGLPLG